MKPVFIKYFSLFFLLFNGTSAFSQTDTSFWFAAPEVSSQDGFDRPIVIRITSYALPCTVTISQPANGGMPTQVLHLPPNSTQSSDLTAWIEYIECKPGDAVKKSGIKITSTADISAYYEVNQNGVNPEIYVLKGGSALGNEFYISSQTIGNNGVFYPIPYSSFNIVASENNTQVTITPTNDIVGHAANTAFTITLNTGETYAAIATSQSAAGHLGGSRVASTKPVAITLSDDLLNSPVYGTCSDLVGDQTIPTSVLGTEYIATNGNLHAPFDKVYVTATENGTSVKQDGAFATTLNAGQSVELSLTNNSTYIQSSLPVYVYQLTGIGCELASAILPPVSCTGSNSITIARSTDLEMYLTVLVKIGGESGFTVNDNSNIIRASQFSAVPGTSNQWLTAKVSLPIADYPLGTAITVKNAASLFHLGALQGNGIAGTSFGYFSNFNCVSANAYALSPDVCDGSMIQLFSNTVGSASYHWNGPGNFVSEQQNPVVLKSSSSNAGNYILTLTAPGCGTYRDTVVVMVKPKELSAIEQTICEGQSYAGHSISGQYIDTFAAANGCDSIRTLNLVVTKKVSSFINQRICEGQNYEGYNMSGTYKDTFVASGGCDSIRTLNLVVTKKVSSTISQTICEGQSYEGYKITGTYVDAYAATNGCDSVRTLNLVVLQKATSIIDKTICEGESYEGYKASGNYTNTFAAANGCDSIRVLHLTVLAKPVPDLGLDKQICQGDSLVLYPGAFSSYVWQDGSTSAHFTVKEPGGYSVMVTNACGANSGEVVVTADDCTIYFPGAFTPNNDGKNDVFNILNADGLQDYDLMIYNRWGQKIFESRDWTKGWNGLFNGQLQNAGVYVWSCRYKKYNTIVNRKGTVVLIR